MEPNNTTQVYLNLVLEFVPETVFRISKHYSKSGQRMPTLFVKLYVFQMCRALAHIHAMGVCHRDIKPQNLLVNTHTHQLKLCDFGSAKVIAWQGTVMTAMIGHKAGVCDSMDRCKNQALCDSVRICRS